MGYSPRCHKELDMTEHTHTQINTVLLQSLYLCAGCYTIPTSCVCAQSLSCVQLFATPWTAALQAPLSFSISLEFAQTHVHSVDGCWHTTSSFSAALSPALNLFQHPSLFQ